MGDLDSFSDGGLYLTTTDALDRAKKLIDSGAKIIDIEQSLQGQAPSNFLMTERLFPILEKVVDLGVPQHGFQ